MPKRYYIVNFTDGEVKRTDNYCLARQYAESDEFLVLDTQREIIFKPGGNQESVQEEP